MRLIDKDAVLKLCSKSGEGVVSYDEVEEKLPEIDAEPVVRCKDCKYAPINLGAVCSPENIKWRDARYFAGEDSEACPYNCGDPWYSVMPEPNWYCWKGKRKEQ